MSAVTYKDAGVDIAVAERATDSIKALAESTHNPNVLKNIGLFSGFFRFDSAQYREPVLVSSIDGVGTKVKLAQQAGVYNSIGVDLVNHCVNDIAVCGARPLFFTDYIAADKLEPEAFREIVKGIALACKAADCALIGGETAEMPGVYSTGSFDLAGSVVGVVERDKIIDGSGILAGDTLLAIPASGVHTNGFSLIRKLLEQDRLAVSDKLDDSSQTSVGEELLRPHKSYLDLISRVKDTAGLTGISHVTGGGIVGNSNRLMPTGLEVAVDWCAWQPPEIFRLIESRGELPPAEMRKVLNLGVGLVLIVRPERIEVFEEMCKASGENAFRIGTVVTKEE